MVGCLGGANIVLVFPVLPPCLTSPQIATRKAYGQALAKLGHGSDRIIALDGDTKNSTFSELFKKEHPDRFIECYIAEQNMVGADPATVAGLRAEGDRGRAEAFPSHWTGAGCRSV